MERQKSWEMARLGRRLETSWTLSFLRHWTQFMTLRSAWRYRKHVLKERHTQFQKSEQIVLHMKKPINFRVRLREAGTDFGTFDEVLVDEVYKPVLNYIEECRTYVDLGANIGLTSLYVAQHFPQCSIFAVEPNPDTYNLLLRNLRPLIRKRRCATLLGAAWDSNTLLMPHGSSSPTQYDAFRLQTPDRATPGKIPAFTMAEIVRLSKFDSIDLLKIDIEGAETQLLSGDTTWLEIVKFIAVEFHGTSRISSQFDDLMRKYQFNVYEPNPHTTFAASMMLRDSSGMATFPPRTLAA